MQELSKPEDVIAGLNGRRNFTPTCQEARTLPNDMYVLNPKP